MKKYDLKKIMTRAWELVKKVGCGIAEALRKSWKEAKEMKELKGSEKQVKWAKDIINKANEIIEKFELYKIKEMFEQQEKASWFIEKYAFLTYAKMSDMEKTVFLVREESELRTKGLKIREANEVNRELYKKLDGII